MALFGLGYVGSVTAACLARAGHRVVGVDVSREKVSQINEGKSPVTEPGLVALIRDGVDSGRLVATTEATSAMARADVALICVGTPSAPDGAIELRFVEQVAADIGRALRERDGYAVVVVRSTIFPGTSSERLIPILERESGKRAGEGFGFCVNPEFLREGSAIRDFDDPPYTVIGELDERSGGIVSELFASASGETIRVPLAVAESVKYACNSFHALKVVFANEVANLCQALGVDGRLVMDLFARDDKLNLSRRYLRPGFAFGGSCLPKDVRAMVTAARDRQLDLPLLGAILPSNELQADRAFEMVRAEQGRKIGIVGLSFKAGTDDLRESPAVRLAERLLRAGFDVTIYDPDVEIDTLIGSNLDYAIRMGVASELLSPSLSQLLEQVEVVVLTKPVTGQDERDLVCGLTPQHRVFDLVGLSRPEIRDRPGSYRGISW